MAFRTNKTPVLQTKSASGAVATFNTALAMPLPSCNIAVNAWQEGSGEPNPIDNIRPIHGFSEVNPTRAGKNLFDKNAVTYGKWIDDATGEIVDISNRYCVSDYIPIKQGEIIYIPRKSTGRNGYFDKNKNALGYFNAQERAVTMAHSGYLVISIDTNNADIDDLQVEAGSTATAYEPYVTPTIYPIQFGQEVYGAEVDAVNGVAHVTHRLEEYDLTDALSATDLGTYTRYLFALSNILISSDTELCNYAPRAVDYMKQTTHFYCGGSSNNRFYLFLDNSITQLSNIQVRYKLAEPFDIQLTPTQIETLIGNNTIFADTGDIDLTYKDFDIAKRGNFREVFKLPS